jgi:hypothetical protein
MHHFETLRCIDMPPPHLWQRLRRNVSTVPPETSHPVPLTLFEPILLRVVRVEPHGIEA